ncbi:GNAT family N-acetyltransferase [Paenibacillus sp. DMB20]|uniref:GNAT family N-acetyltransferase n=1 Tax=Paenibacillus sp. DMB20 TaxID=1642570 RepID=UPI00069B7885|nr:GNAT family N-acetyltransferase [Paenibacillus sp. DMB20]
MIKFFSRNKVNSFYQLWIEKSVKGSFDDYCLLFKSNGKILGFATIREHKDEKTASIGLLGITPESQGRGYGTRLIEDLKVFLVRRQIKQLMVATQGRNYKALNLYIKSGFKINKIESWFYWSKKLTGSYEYKDFSR